MTMENGGISFVSEENAVGWEKKMEWARVPSVHTVHIKIQIQSTPA